MRIAFDAELFYDEEERIASPGMVELLLGIYTMNIDNKIYIWSDKGERHARHLATKGGLRNGRIDNTPTKRYDMFEFMDKNTFQGLAELHFNKKGKRPKGKTVITTR